MPHIVVVGAGQAGFSLVARLRQLQFDGELTLIGDEKWPPYQRPPLSKKYLVGEFDLERLYLRQPAFYETSEVNLLSAATCQSIDPEARSISVDGRSLQYDELVLATGSAPRRLPPAVGGALDGVCTVRSIGDVDAIADRLKTARRLLVVGGGYIGLEVAASARYLGLEVVVVEMAERILQRVASRETSDRIRRLHLNEGVDIRESTGLVALLGDNRVEGAELSDGSRIAADLVVVGIGISPRDELAQKAGLRTENGIWTDSRGRTSARHIWAAGDCASFPWRGSRIRLESVQNAIDQAELVADNICGAGRNYDPTPWFWSDQFDAKLQIAGLGKGYDTIVERQGVKPASVSLWYFRGDEFLAVDAINDPRAYMVGKRLLETGKRVSRSKVGDTDVNLKSLLR